MEAHDLEERGTKVPLSLSMRQKIGLGLAAYIVLLLAASIRVSSTRIESGSLLLPAIVLGVVLTAVLTLALLGDLRHLQIGKAKGILVCVLTGSVITLLVSVAFESQLLTMILEIPVLVSLFLLLKDIPGPSLSESLRREGRYFLVGGAVCSLGTMAVCSLGWGLFMWALKGTFLVWPRFLFPGTPQFVVMGTVFGPTYILVRRRVPLPATIVGIFYGFGLFLLLSSLRSMLTDLPSWFIIQPYYDPDLTLQAIPWLVYGLMLGFFARSTGFKSPREFSARESITIHALALLILALVLVAWAYPALIGPSAEGAALTPDELPPGYTASLTRYTTIWERILTKITRSLHGDATIPYTRLDQILESPSTPDQTSRTIMIKVRSSTPSTVSRYLKEASQTMQDQIPAEIQALGDQWTAWESYPLPNHKQIIFQLGRFLVHIDGFSATWSEITQTAMAMEEHLQTLP